jgi:hypothetical protein
MGIGLFNESFPAAETCDRTSSYSRRTPLEPAALKLAVPTVACKSVNMTGETLQECNKNAGVSSGHMCQLGTGTTLLF